MIVKTLSSKQNMTPAEILVAVRSRNQSGATMIPEPKPVVNPNHKTSLDSYSPLSMDLPLFISLIDYVRGPARTDNDISLMIQKMLTLNPTNSVFTNENFVDITGQQISIPVCDSSETMLFRMNSRSLWSRLAWSFLNYSIALNSEIDGKEQAEARIYSHIAKLGDFIRPYYSRDQVTTFVNALNQFAYLGIKVIQDLKAGIPLDGTKERWDSNVEDIANFLSSLNPESWPKEAVKTYFTEFVRLWVESIRARSVQDWAANEKAMDDIDTLIVSGDANQTSLADVFSLGIISQYPDYFSM